MTRIEDLEARAARMKERIKELSPPKADGDARDLHWNDMTHEQRKRASRRKDVEANLVIVEVQISEHHASLAAPQ